MTPLDPTARLLRAAAGPEPAGEDATTEAVIDAALRQFELFGLARTTMDDIARRAGVSRVTIYRRFAGKDTLVDAVLLREVRRFLVELDRAIAPLATAEEKLVEGFVFTLEAVRGHRLLQRMLESEPELVLPHFTVQGAAVIDVAREFLAAGLAREVPDDRGGNELLTVADIAVRLVISFALSPQTIVDLDDPAVARDFARRYLSPILIAS